MPTQTTATGDGAVVAMAVELYTVKLDLVTCVNLYLQDVR